VAQLVESLCYKAEVMGSIPGSVIVSFHCHSPSSHTMALGLTQPVTEMSTRNTSFMCWLSRNLGASTLCNPMSLFGLCRDCFTSTIQNLVAQVTWHLLYVHSCCKGRQGRVNGWCVKKISLAESLALCKFFTFLVWCGWGIHSGIQYYIISRITSVIYSIPKIWNYVLWMLRDSST